MANWVKQGKQVHAERKALKAKEAQRVSLVKMESTDPKGKMAPSDRLV